MDSVKNSLYGKRIQFLLDTPRLATTLVGHVFGQVHSNCWGTAVYVVGGEQRVRELWAAEGYDVEKQIDALGNFIRIPQDNAPGYIGGDPMELFLKTCSLSIPMADTIVNFYWSNQNDERCGFLIRHSGILLDGAMFHQPGLGEPFVLETIDDYVASLSEEAVNTLAITYYSPTSRSA